MVTGKRAGGCKERVPPGLGCFSQEAVNLSIVIKVLGKGGWAAFPC